VSFTNKMGVKNLYHVKLNRAIELPWVETSHFFLGYIMLVNMCNRHNV